MKRLLMLLVIAMCGVSCSKLYALNETGENMDSLLHKVTGHRQGIVFLDDDGIKLDVYTSSSCQAPNGMYYYRWSGGDRIFYGKGWPYYTHTETPLAYGYRHADDKIYVYNFETDTESIAYDFTLQPGDEWTTPDGISWKVVGRRTELFESKFDYVLDYRNEHTVLSVQSADGEMTDEWVEYIGAIYHPLQAWGWSDVKYVHTAFFNFDESGGLLVCFPFSEDPVYGHYVDVAPDPDAHETITRDFEITAGSDSLTVTLSHYPWFTRDYCYTYRDGDTFYINSFEIGPVRDGNDPPKSFGLSFPASISVNNPAIFLNGEQLTTSIQAPEAPSAYTPAFDLTGRRLAAPPRRGLYIEDGRVKARVTPPAAGEVQRR